MLYRLIEHYDISNYQRYKLIENNITPESIDECFICLQENLNEEIPIKLMIQDLYIKTCNCDGYIHKDCLSRWHKIHNSCPICRRNMIRLSNKNIQNLFKNPKIAGFIYFNIYEPVLKIVYSEITKKIVVIVSRILFYSSFLIIWYSIVTFYYIILFYLR